MQIYTSFQTNNHASTPPLSFYRPDALPAVQPTASKQHLIRVVIIYTVVQHPMNRFDGTSTRGALDTAPVRSSDLLNVVYVALH